MGQVPGVSKMWFKLIRTSCQCVVIIYVSFFRMTFYPDLYRLVFSGLLVCLPFLLLWLFNFF